MRLWLRSAELFYVTPDMTATALDGSLDLPPWIPAAVMPAPVGLLVWAGDLPPFRIRGHAARAVRGMLWVTHGGQLHLHPLLEHDQRVEMTEIKPVDAADEVQPGRDGGDAAGVAFLTGATWIMMQQPTVAAPRAVNGAADSSRLMRQLPRRVTVIDLRPMRNVHVDHDPDHPGRVYAHRWIVRGHWRDQAHGPGRTERKRIWVPSHTKGPDGAPLLAKEHVNVWRR